MSEAVYVIGPKDSQTVKIGVSNKSHRRLRQIQLMSPISLSILWSHPGGRDLEEALHGRFWKYRTHGEWFTFPAYMPPVPTIKKAVAALQYDIDDSGRVQAWPDAPICEEGSRQHWLNRRLREAFGYRPFSLPEAASRIGAPLRFVEEYAAALEGSASLVRQTVTGTPVYVMQWLEGDRYDLLGASSATR